MDAFDVEFKGKIGGTPIQKISIYKLLIAIAQDAVVIGDEIEWKSIGVVSFGDKCREYLEKYKDCFWLYGDRPFLQYPELNDQNIPTKVVFCRYIPDLSADNDTIIRETQTDPPVDDGERALFLLSLMSYALGGKRVSNLEKILREPSIRGKSAKSAPSLGGGSVAGYQQSLFLCDAITETVYCNYFTCNEISSTGYVATGILPPWREMPTLEDSSYNENYKRSIYAWFLAMSRAVLLTNDGLKYCEGIVYSGEWFEPFISKNEKGRIQIVNPTMRTWRSLPSLLAGAFSQKDQNRGCFALKIHLSRLRSFCGRFEIWSGGLRVRGNSGDQSIKGDDDFVESSVMFYSEVFGDESFNRLCDIVCMADSNERKLFSSLNMYYENLGFGKNRGFGKAACVQYLQVLDSMSQSIVDSSISKDESDKMKRLLFRLLLDVYDSYCLKESARQIFAWYRCRNMIVRERSSL